MKKITISIVLSVVGWFTTRIAQAQGTLYLSNLAEPPGGSAVIGSDAWVGGLVRTGPNTGGYDLNSVRLLMDPAAGSPSDFSISLYSYNPVTGQPGSGIGSLSGSDPAAGGNFLYTTSGLGLSSSTRYVIVLTAATPVVQGVYAWSAANTSSYDSSDGWLLASDYYISTDGSSWGPWRGGPLQLAIYATPVPEPATYALAGLALAVFGIRMLSAKHEPVSPE